MKSFEKYLEEKNKGLWHNIHAKRKRGEKMRKPGEEGAPTDADFKRSQNESWGDKMPKSERPGWVKDPKTGKWVKPTQVKKEETKLDEVSTDKLRDYASAALQDKNKAKADKRWKYAGKAMQKVADRDVKAKHDLKYNKTEAVEEKTLTPAEKKKREEIAKAMERDNPGMDMKKKMAIATWQAKKVAEEVKIEEDITKMPDGRLKWHMNTGVPHGSYTKDELKKEKARRLSRVDTHKAYVKAKPSMNEESELEEGFYHVEYGRSGKLTHQVVAKDAKDAHQKAMAHLKKKNPKLAHPDYADTFNKPSITHIKGNEPRADKYKTEATEIDEISLSHLSNKIANSTGTKNIKTAMKPGEVKKGLDDLRKRLGTLGKQPKLAKEAKEDDEPASPDEAGMALKQLEFIEYAAEEMMDHIKSGKAFPEWFQNKLSKAHGEIEGLHSAMGEHGSDKKEDEKEMDESVVSADKKPEKYVKPDGSVGIRMTRVDKNVIKKDA